MKNNKKILITGGAGFIGSHFVKYFLKKYPDFKTINLDALTYAGNILNLKKIQKNKNYKFIKGDITDAALIEKIFKKERPTYLVNFAAESHVDRSIHDHARDFIDTNIYGVFSLLEASRKFGIEKFIQISTDEVYGSLDFKSKKKFNETMPYKPNSPYSASKASGDLLCHAYYSTYNIPVIITHSSNNYGSHQYPEKLIPYFTLRALQNKDLPLYGDGQNVRDWIYVLDNVKAIERVLFHGKAGEIYNIGGNNEIKNIDIAKKILEILKKPQSLIKFAADRPGHDKRYAIDSSKINSELGFKPKYDFEKTLFETITWYKNNPLWIKNTTKKIQKVNPHIKF